MSDAVISAAPALHTWGCRRRSALSILLLTLWLPQAVRGQTTTLGVIEGTVSDQTGASLPGVTLTLTSPVLQVPQLVTVSDGEGRYRFPELRVGIYRLQAELQGFNSAVFERLEITVGFVARVNVQLQVGSLAETVTVSGAGPIVDLTTTRGGQTLNTEVLTKAVPLVGHQVDLVKLTPGLAGGVGTRAGNPTSMGLQGNMSVSAYGQSGATAMIEDFQMHSNNQPPMLTGTNQMDVRSFGNSAEIQNPGAALNYVFPAGGNEFHGRFAGLFMNDTFQSSNIGTDVLRAQGFTTPEELRAYADLQGQISGRILQDKVWFFATGRRRDSERTIGGFAQNAGPDGRYLTGDEPAALPEAHQWGQVVRVANQLSQKYQLNLLWWRDRTWDAGTCTSGLFGGANCRVIPFEASTTYNIRDMVWNGEFRGTPTGTMTFMVKGGRAAYQTRYAINGDPMVPTRWNRNTSLYTGSPISNGAITAAQRKGDTRFHQYVANLSVIPQGALFNGDHQFKVGYRSILAQVTGGAPNHPAGNYGLVFDTVGGVPDQPVEIRTLSLPVSPKNRLNIHSLYLSDQWQLSPRLTFNLGLRFDRQNAYVPPQEQEASTFVTAASYGRIDVGIWNMLAPRAAVAWDPSGSGRTVLKATYGRFNDELPYFVGTFTDMYNPVVTTETQYRWRDLNGNRDYDPGEVDLSLSGRDFISITGARNTAPLDPGVRIPHSEEFAVTLERELMPNMGTRLLYIYKRRSNNYVTVNGAIPYSAYNIPLQRRDPGPDSLINTADDGSMVTIYDFDPAYRGGQFVRNERVNTDNDDWAQTLEGSVNRRMAGRWSLMGALSATRQHRWLSPIIATPNDEYFPIDETWSWVVRGSGSYTLPGDVQLGATLNVRSGFQGQRTYVFRSVDPLGGPRLNQLSTVTLRLEPFGASRGPVQKYLDARLGKTFRPGGEREVLLSLDVLNALNDSSAQQVTYLSGPTFGQITLIPTPRAVRLGVQIGF